MDAVNGRGRVGGIVGAQMSVSKTDYALASRAGADPVCGDVVAQIRAQFDGALPQKAPAPRLARSAPPQAAKTDALKILIVAGQAAEAGLIRRQLRRAKLNFTARRVDTRAGFAAALESFAPDLLLVSNQLRDFAGVEALAHVRRVHPETPVVMVTGALGDEAVIELLDAGARDCVLKSNLRRLPAAIERAIAVEQGIRARKSAEAALRTNSALLQTVERLAHIGGFDWDIASGRLFWSEETYRMFGLTPGEFLPDIRAFVARVHPDDRRRVWEATEASLTQNVPLDVEFRIQRPDKTERIIHASGEIVRAAAGEPTRVIGASHDITEHEQVVENLRASEERFRLLVEHAPDAILLYDADQDRFVDANKAAERLFACTRGEIIGHRPRHFYPDEQPDGQPFVRSFAEHLERALAGAEITFERRICNARGEERWCQVTLVRLPSANTRLLRASHYDITDRRNAERTLRRLNRTLRALSRGNEVLVRAGSEAELLDEMCRVMVDAGGYRLSWIGIAQHDAAKSVTPVASAGNGADYLDKAQITWADEPRGRGMVGRAIRSGEAQTSQNMAVDPAMLPWREEARKHGFSSSIALPLKDESGVFGVLTMYSAETNAFDGDELKLLQELANDLAFGIRTQREHVARQALDKRWRASLEATIGAIASTVEIRDPYTAGHQQRVARLAIAIARELHLPEQRIQGLYLAGIVHDVGKINIPAEILSKPGKLSKLQYQLIQAHAEAGYDIVKGVDFPWPIAEMVRQHHERIDGSGYPRGLKAEAILLEAKILAVADVVEAMMSHRPYRASLGIAAALAEIAECRGRSYDAGAVDACAALFRENRFSFE